MPCIAARFKSHYIYCATMRYVSNMNHWFMPGIYGLPSPIVGANPAVYISECMVFGVANPLFAYVNDDFG